MADIAASTIGRPAAPLPAVPTGVTIEPFLPQFGAAVSGLDVAQIRNKEDLQPVLDILHRYDVVAFRDQNLTPQQMAHFTRLMGEPEEHQYKQYVMPDCREVMVISNVKRDGKNIGSTADRIAWHTDMQYLTIPAAFSMLYGVEVPPVGAETWFISTAMAYEALSAEDKEKLYGLRVRHSGMMLYAISMKNNPNLKPMSEAQRAATPDAVHPLIRTHPATGRRSLYVSSDRTFVAFEGMDEDAGKALQNRLYKHVFDSSPVYKHAWKPNDLLVWDNRMLFHTATPYDQTKYTRLMYRTSVRGEAPM